MWRGEDLARSPRAPIAAFLGTHPLIPGIGLGCLCLAAGLWGHAAEDPTHQTPLELTTYFLLPLMVLAAIVASRWLRSRAILAAVGLLMVEAALLGAGPLIALPFVVAVPLVSVAVAARILPVGLLKIPYVGAWAASSAGVAVAVLGMGDNVAPSALVVIPAFLFVDALALAMLWHLDAGRLRAGGEAAAAEARISDLLNGVDLVGIHVTKASGVDFINDFALKLTGWTREEVIGADWWDTFVPLDRREEARANWDRVDTGQATVARRRESTILTKSGEIRLIRWSHVERYDADGKLTGVASLGEDVTALRAAQESARRAAELLSTLVVSSPLPTAVLGLDRRVQLWNPAAAELLGWSEAEVVGKPVPPAMYANDRKAIARTFARAGRGHPLDHELVALRRRDGQIVRVRMYGGVLLDSEGKPMSVGLQAIDVTASLQIEEQLREAQKMEAVGRLAGGVAHDFNNSLTAIGGFASLIASGSKEPETVEAAETILGAAKRAADLTRELLAYSRRSMLQPQVVDVNSLIGALRPMLLRLLGEDVGVVITSQVSEAMVRVDPGGLERVILNLAANARDAMPGGGRLTISTDRRVLAGPDGGEEQWWVVVSVADNGAGIPPQLHSQVFDPFFTTKPVGSGTGLGLAMVKGFVVQSGGQVALHSEPGLGTTIEVQLPEVTEVRAPQIQPALVSEPDSDCGDETILVVEDEPAVAAVTRQALTRCGYRVLTAENGESAIGLLRAHAGPVAVLLVDVVLPDMRGPQLVEAALAIHPESAVLYASGYSSDAIDRRVPLPAGVELIEKPYTPAELLRRVRMVIDFVPSARA